MRWAQLTLVENDPPTLNFGFWLDYFGRIHADAACLSGGGCVAYYPTDVPYHHRSRWLGGRDVLGEMIAGCRGQKMVVLARTDPHATYDDAAAAHPDWIAVGPDGRPRRHPSSPELWLTCGLGPYNFDFMTAVHREIMQRYRVDGIFINRWDGTGMCYCEHCRENFHRAAGLDLPRTNHPADPARHAYILWRQERLFSLWQLWDREVRAIHPDSCVIPNTGGGSGSSLDMQRVGELAPTLMADRQARSGVIPPWANGKNAKEYRATMGRKPIVGIFSMGLEEAYRWKDSVQSPDEIRLWVLDGIANGLRPWCTKFGATVTDGRWLKPVEEIYGWCHREERYLRNERPLARVAIVYSQQTAWFAGDGEKSRDLVENAALGWYQALVEARIPFEMVHDRRLAANELGSFRTLILPNVIALSDRQCAQLRDFVRRGGSVIATSQTSLRDETGMRRANFGLAELLGVDFVADAPGPMKNAYLRIEPTAPDAFGHELLSGLEDTPRIIHGLWRLDVRPTVPFARPVVTLIPPYPDLPMEEVFAREPTTNIAEVYLRNFGAGRVVYFPWDIDRTFWEVLAVDHLKLLQNAVRWATNEPPPVTVTGPGVFDVTVWEQRHSITVHLVNLTNPMMMKGPIRELIRSGEQRVSVRLPAGRAPAGARLLVADTVVPYRRSGDGLELIVPSVLAHEVVAIDLA